MNNCHFERRFSIWKFFVIGLLCVVIITQSLITTKQLGDISTLISISNKDSITNDSFLTDDYKLAERQSDGFFDDIQSHHWKLIHQKVMDIYPNFNLCCPGVEGSDRRNRQSGWYYQNHYEPDFVCTHERRIGRLGDGGKWVCDPHRIKKKGSCLVYSVGSRNEFDFEEGVFDQINKDCEIHTFDPADFSKLGAEAGVQYHQLSFGAEDDNRTNTRSLKSIVKELGHEGRTIDLFKIDCENCEWASASSWFEANVTLRQIQVELHKAPIPGAKEFFDTMYENNYVITHKEANIAYPMGGNQYAIEYAFLKLTPEFFEDIRKKPYNMTVKGKLVSVNRQVSVN